jgi:two-component system copper resistance phosphate regulon response regulator CusR
MADRKRILVADDDPDLLEFLKMDLDFLQIALTEKLDLVLLDVMMPYIDGYHVAYELTTKLGDNSPRIMIMTSRDTIKEKGIALMSGAMEVLQKPFEMAKLHERVADILSNKPKPKPTPPPVPPPAKPS